MFDRVSMPGAACRELFPTVGVFRAQSHRGAEVRANVWAQSWTEPSATPTHCQECSSRISSVCPSRAGNEGQEEAGSTRK